MSNNFSCDWGLAFPISLRQKTTTAISRFKVPPFSPETGAQLTPGMDGETPVVGLVGGGSSSITKPVATVAGVRKVPQASFFDGFPQMLVEQHHQKAWKHPRFSHQTWWLKHYQRDIMRIKTIYILFIYIYIMLLQAGGFRYAVCLQHFATMFWKMISSDSMINVFQEVETTNHVIQLFYIYRYQTQK